MKSIPKILSTHHILSQIAVWGINLSIQINAHIPWEHKLLFIDFVKGISTPHCRLIVSETKGIAAVQDL